MDLYSYVGDDPINKTDPTGLSCIMADKGQYSCKVDDPGKLNKSEINAVNKAYTKAVNQLLRHPDRNSTISINGKSFVVNAGNVAKSLIGAKITGGGTSSEARASTAGGELTGIKTEGDRQETTVYKNAISRSAMDNNTDDRALSETLIHEAFHNQQGEGVFKEFWNQDREKFQKDHHDPYNRAAYDLF